MSTLQQQLATALEISPDDILTFKPYPTGYAIITTDMRKFTNVQPTEEKQPAPDVIATTDDPLEDVPFDPPKDIRDDLKDVFFNPDKHTVSELRELAAFLEIPAVSKTKKSELIFLILNWPNKSSA